MIMRRYFSILLIIFLFSSCDVSTLSDADAKNIEKLKVHIQIKDGDREDALNQIKVVLTDGKKKIINENIKVLLNGFPLELYVKNELYYTKTSFYRTDSLRRSDSYYFEIILPDSTTYPLAYIKPMIQNRNTEFNIPDRISTNEDFVFNWNHLYTPHHLEFQKGTLVIKETSENITQHGFGERQMDTLKAPSGNYTIPKSYFNDSLTIPTRLEIKLERIEYGLTNPKLIKNSTIEYNRTLEKTIHFDEN